MVRLRAHWYEQWGHMDTPRSFPLYRDFGANLVVDCTFKGNVAGDRGGALALETRYSGSGMPLWGVLGARFENNTAENGGAVHVGNTFAGALVLQGITAFNNMAREPTREEDDLQWLGQGGFLAVSAPEPRANAVVIRQSQLWSNGALRGGVVHAGPGANVFLSGVLAMENRASDGAVIYCDACDIVGTQMDSLPALEIKGKEVELKGSQLPEADNQLPQAGKDVLSALKESDSNPHAGRITLLQGNLAKVLPIEPDTSGRGGAIYCHQCGVLALTRTVLRANSATTAGGAVFTSGQAFERGLVLVVSECTFEGNFVLAQEPGGYGGAVFAHAAKIMMNGTQFVNNMARVSSGRGAGGAGWLGIDWGATALRDALAWYREQRATNSVASTRTSACATGPWGGGNVKR